MFSALLVVAVLLIAVLLGAIGLYNSLVALNQRVEEAWSGIDILLKQRRDQLSKLVEVVKGAKDFEQATLEKVIKARSASIVPNDPAGAAAQGSVLKGLLALAESYPDLKSNQNFLQLQAEIGRLEEALAGRRDLYNAAVRDNNTRLGVIPDKLVAPAAGLRQRDYFQVDDADKQDVAIKF
jgi:LemA protein